MLNTIMNQMVSLSIAIGINVLLGLYYNINVKSIKFEASTLFNGLIKAAIIAVSFIGLAFCFDMTDLSSIGISPELIMNAAVILYVTKDIQNLMKILGVESVMKKL